MISEKERKHRGELFKLIQENPDLPVMPMVDGELVGGDEFSRWMGSWGSVQMDEYLIPQNDCQTVRKLKEVLEKGKKIWYNNNNKE